MKASIIQYTLQANVKILEILLANCECFDFCSKITAEFTARVKVDKCGRVEFIQSYLYFPSISNQHISFFQSISLNPFKLTGPKKTIFHANWID